MSNVVINKTAFFYEAELKAGKKLHFSVIEHKISYMKLYELFYKRIN